MPQGMEAQPLSSNERPESAQFEDLQTNTWFNFYGTFRISDRWFWIGQFHFRRAGTENTPFLGQMAQIYNRHAISYLFSPRFNASLGGVLRIDYSDLDTQRDEPEFNNTVLEPRIWHQYSFAMPFDNFMIYHRLRIEHRWNKGFQKEAQYSLRHRYRYRIAAKIPLNKRSLSPGAFYINPDVEVILQSGKNVIDSPLEDLRLVPIVGYIMNPRITFAFGPMYTTGQRLSDGTQFRQRWIMRFHTYISLDFRKLEKKLPDVRTMD